MTITSPTVCARHAQGSTMHLRQNGGWPSQPTRQQPGNPWYARDPPFKPIRKDPTFVALMTLLQQRWSAAADSSHWQGRRAFSRTW